MYSVLWQVLSILRMQECPLKTNVPLEEILNEIERQTDYLFMYSNAVDVKRHASIHVSEKPVSEVLNQLLGNQVLYEMEGTHIILSDKHSPGIR